MKRDSNYSELKLNLSNLMFFLFLALSFPHHALALPGDLDTSFNNDGIVTTDFDQCLDEANAIAIQSDGRILVAGRATDRGNTCGSGDDVEFALARYNSNGTLDTAFDSDGRKTIVSSPRN